MTGGGLEGHVTVVTGGNGGIGLGIARGLADAGARVAVWGRHEAKTASAVASLGDGAVGVRCEVADEDDVSRAMGETLERLGRVDSFFANAGISGAAAPIHEMAFDEWRRVLAVNLDGTFLSVRAAAAHMVERGEGGSIVVVSSTSSIHGAARKAHYGTSKTAVLGLVRAVAVELAPHRIRCNALLPGWTATDMTSPDGAFSKSSYDRFVENTTFRTPVRRWADPDEFGAVAAYLADPRHTFHTGDSLVVDGGYTVF